MNERRRRLTDVMLEGPATRSIAFLIIIGYLIIVVILGAAILIASLSAGSSSDEPLVVAKSIELLKFLTAVFGAWIGAIIAFYFSKEGTDKITDQLAAHMKELTSLASQAYGITQETLKELEKHKVEEIMSKHTDANLARKDTGRNDLETKFKDVDVVLVTDKEQLIGIITREDMAKKEKNTAEGIMTTIESPDKFYENTVVEDANAYTVYLKMTKTGHEKIPVVNEKKELVGIAQRKKLDKLLRKLEGVA